MKESTNLVDLAARLIWSREQKGWTQEQLANAADVSQSTIGNLESRIRRTARKLAVIANVLDVNAYWLATGEGSPRDQPDDPLLAQVAELSPAGRSVVATVVAGLRGVSVGALPTASTTAAELSAYEKRILELIQKLNDRSRETAEDQLKEILREQRQHAYRESESPAERERLERTVASKTHPLGVIETPPKRQRKS
jgi:transcriptional regulator with XRE-family HTH domain